MKQNMVTTLIHIVVLLMLSIILGFIANIFFPNKLAWVGNWNHRVEEQAHKENIALVDYNFVVKAIDEQSHILLDARSIDDYEAGQISGAVSLPADSDLEASDVFAVLTPEDNILIYCAGVECDNSLILAVNLREHDFTNLVIYAGGWDEWEQKEKQ